jgi:hypothetical protein
MSLHQQAIGDIPADTESGVDFHAELTRAGT